MHKHLIAGACRRGECREWNEQQATRRDRRTETHCGEPYSEGAISPSLPLFTTLASKPQRRCSAMRPALYRARMAQQRKAPAPSNLSGTCQLRTCGIVCGPNEVSAAPAWLCRQAACVVAGLH